MSWKKTTMIGSVGLISMLTFSAPKRMDIKDIKPMVEGPIKLEYEDHINGETAKLVPIYDFRFKPLVLDKKVSERLEREGQDEIIKIEETDSSTEDIRVNENGDEIIVIEVNSDADRVNSLKSYDPEAILYNYVENGVIDRETFRSTNKKVGYGWLSQLSDKEITERYYRNPTRALSYLVLKKVLYMMNSGKSDRNIFRVVKDFKRRIKLYKNEMKKDRIMYMSAREMHELNKGVFSAMNFREERLEGKSDILYSLVKSKGWKDYLSSVVIAQGFSEIMGYKGDFERSWNYLEFVLENLGLDYIESWPATWDSLISMGINQKTSAEVRDLGEKELYKKGYSNRMYHLLKRWGVISGDIYMPTSVIYVHRAGHFISTNMAYLFFLHRLELMYDSIRASIDKRAHRYIMENIDRYEMRKDLAVYMALANYMTGDAPRIFRRYMQDVLKNRVKLGSFDRWIQNRTRVARKTGVPLRRVRKLANYASKYVDYWEHTYDKVKDWKGERWWSSLKLDEKPEF